ncbi:MAG: hypothetical protein JJT75_14750, partial [Opitutales bacterium]|nr:hypothetical protein [Opitutales bacterium]
RENVEGLTERAWKDVVLGRETVIDPEEPKLLNVVLELRKKGEIVKLYRFDGELEVRADGSGRIMRLDPPDNRRPGTLVRERDGIMHDVENIENYIEEDFSIRDVLLFTEFEDGEFADQTVIVVAQREAFYPEKMKLWLGDAEGGFQRSAGQVSREVVLAPEEGYEQTLLFTFADVEAGNVWSYFKVDGHYGKVRISERHSMEVSEDLDWVRFRLTFFLNPTPGDRNLETGR